MWLACSCCYIITYIVYVRTCYVFQVLPCCSLLCVQPTYLHTCYIRTYLCFCPDFISHECRLFLTTSELHLVASLMRLYSCMMDEIKDSGPDGKPSMQGAQVRTFSLALCGNHKAYRKINLVRMYIFTYKRTVNRLDMHCMCTGL